MQLNSYLSPPSGGLMLLPVVSCGLLVPPRTPDEERRHVPRDGARARRAAAVSRHVPPPRPRAAPRLALLAPAAGAQHDVRHQVSLKLSNFNIRAFIHNLRFDG